MIYESAIIDNAGLRYQVQVRRLPDGTVQQRHKWFATATGSHTPPRVDPWIFSPPGTYAATVARMTPSADRDEIGELLAALEDIASGHNDARGRASEALTFLRKAA